MNLKAPIQREVKGELLDSLPVASPSALGSRRDLFRLNLIMGNARMLRRELSHSLNGVRSRNVMDIGAGDGRFMLEVARDLGYAWQGTTLLLVDRQEAVQPRTFKAFQALGWTAQTLQTDVLQLGHSLNSDRFCATVSNLFLHHFSNKDLAQLLADVARRTSLFIAIEPRRSTFTFIASCLVLLIGCNAVTRYDARVSVRAGFQNHELSALWPSSADWELREFDSGLFSHLFVALRKTPATP